MPEYNDIIEIGVPGAAEAEYSVRFTDHYIGRDVTPRQPLPAGWQLGDKTGEIARTFMISARLGRREAILCPTDLPQSRFNVLGGFTWYNYVLPFVENRWVEGFLPVGTRLIAAPNIDYFTQGNGQEGGSDFFATPAGIVTLRPEPIPARTRNPETANTPAYPSGFNVAAVEGGLQFSDPGDPTPPTNWFTPQQQFRATFDRDIWPEGTRYDTALVTSVWWGFLTLAPFTPESASFRKAWGRRIDQSATPETPDESTSTVIVNILDTWRIPIAEEIGIGNFVRYAGTVGYVTGTRDDPERRYRDVDVTRDRTIRVSTT